MLDIEPIKQRYPLGDVPFMAEQHRKDLAALVAEVERLRLDVADDEAHIKEAFDRGYKAGSEALTAERDALKAALRELVDVSHHHRSCPHHTCDCGLAQSRNHARRLLGEVG